jgi:predicted nucleotidyltransferase
MINLEDGYLSVVRLILKTHIPNQTVWLFGSRATEKVKPHSDIDLVIINKAPLPILKRALLEDDFAESNLPYKVDLLEWATLDDNFKNIITKHYEQIQ